MNFQKILILKKNLYITNFVFS